MTFALRFAAWAAAGVGVAAAAGRSGVGAGVAAATGGGVGFLPRMERSLWQPVNERAARTQSKISFLLMGIGRKKFKAWKIQDF
jgi:hypothetical protein